MQYTIIRVYRVPANSKVQASERFMEAIENGVERDFHVRDYIKQDASQVARRQPQSFSWWALVRRQLVGR